MKNYKYQIRKIILKEVKNSFKPCMYKLLISKINKIIISKQASRL